MIIARHLIDQMVAHAREQAPLECCGLIACRHGEAVEVYRATNAAGHPEVHYEIDGHEQWALLRDIEAAGDELGGIYHSHVRDVAAPSLMDITTAAYPKLLYVIVGLAAVPGPVVRGYRIVDGTVTEEQIESG